MTLKGPITPSKRDNVIKQKWFRQRSQWLLQEETKEKSQKHIYDVKLRSDPHLLEVGK